MEQFRRLLIRWNIAPLSIVVFFGIITYQIIQKLLDDSCTMDPVLAGVLATCAAGIISFLYKMYDSLQKDRGRNDSYRDREEDNPN